MSDIFVSYDDVDRPRVRRLVDALEARGWSVWWDHEIIAGDAFSQVIERELDAARCVIVAWSNTSVESTWVRAEASEGWKRGKLVPVLLDSVRPPMPFGQIHAANLVGWEQPGHPGFARLLEDLRHRIGDPAPRGGTETVAGGRSTEGASPPTRRRGLAAVAVAGVLLVSLAIYYVGSSSAGARANGGEGESRGGADAAAPAPASAGVAGDWEAEVTYPDGATFQERFTFDVGGDELSGTASMRGYGNRRGLLDATVTGNRVDFRTTGTVQLDLHTIREISYRYRGVQAGDSIRFTTVVDGSGDPPFGFTAHRISAEEAARVATGGTRPRLGGMSTNGLYDVDHVRDRVASLESAMTRCYQAAEFDPVSHEFVAYDLTLSATGHLEGIEMRPRIAGLEGCMREALGAVEWGSTDTGEGGTMQINIDARLPWNP